MPLPAATVDQPRSVRAHLLGEVRVVVDGQELALGAVANRVVLAMLLLAGGQMVTKERLVEAIWGEEPPDAESALRVSITRLRKRVAAAGWSIRSGGNGYRLEGDYRLDTAELDALEESMHVERTDEERFTAALAATSLWSGRTLGEIAVVDVGRRLAARFDSRRRAARAVLQETATTPVRLQRCAAEFAEWASEDPLDETAACAYASVLAAGGRTTAALRHLAAMRDRLAELGLEVGRSLVELELRLLTQSDATPVESVSRPCSLPPELALAFRSPLVGRDAELADLHRVWRRAEILGLQVLRVAGPPGIGKTALLAHFGARLAGEGVHVVYARTDPDSHRPLELVATLMSQLVTDFDEWTLTEDVDTGAPIARLAVVELAAATLGTALGGGDTLIVVDDLGDIDELSLAVLERLVERRPHCATMVVAAERSISRSRLRNPVSTKVLGPLSARPLAQWIGPTGEWDVDDLHALTGGVPLLVEHALACGPGDIGELSEVGAVLFGHQAGGLAEEVLDTISTAALLGATFSVAELFAMRRLPPDEVVDHLDAAIRRGLLVDDPGDTLSFRHQLFRRAALARWSQFRLAHTHADLLARTDLIEFDPLRALRHAERAGPLLDRQAAVRLALRAGREQVQATAYGDARRSLQLGARRIGDAPETIAEVEVLSLLGTCFAADGEDEQARAAFEAALSGARRLDDVGALTDVFTASAVVRTPQCLRRHLDEMLALVARIDVLPAATQARFLRRLSRLLGDGDPPAVAAELRRRMSALVPALEPTDQARVLAATYGLLPSGDDPAHRLAEVAEVMGSVEGDPWGAVDGFAGAIGEAIAAGQLDEAETMVGAAIDAARRSDDAYAEWMAMGAGFTVAFLRGDLASAEARAYAALRHGKEAGIPARDSFDAQRFAVRWVRGDLAETLATMRAHGAADAAFVWRCLVALAAAVEGDLDKAGEQLDRCTPEMASLGGNFLGRVTAAMAVDAAWLVGHRPLAAEGLRLFDGDAGRVRFSSGLMDYGPAARYAALCRLTVGLPGGVELLESVAASTTAGPLWQARARADLASSQGRQLDPGAAWSWVPRRRTT